MKTLYHGSIPKFTDLASIQRIWVIYEAIAHVAWIQQFIMNCSTALLDQIKKTICLQMMQHFEQAIQLLNCTSTSNFSLLILKLPHICFLPYNKQQSKLHITIELFNSILTSAFFFLFFWFFVFMFLLTSYTHNDAKLTLRHIGHIFFIIIFSVPPFIKQTIQEYHKTNTCPEYFIFLNDLYTIRKDF